MFTGLIQCLGEVLEVSGDEKGRKFKIKHHLPETRNINEGDSVACNGICLTATNIRNNCFDAFAGEETLQITTAISWQTGTKLNIESSLRIGDNLNGHFVFGHVDGTAILTNITTKTKTTYYDFSLENPLTQYLAPKASVAVNGISLTVVTADNNSFSVMIIPYTLQATTLYNLDINSAVNIEVDMLARYVKRQLDHNSGRL